MRNLKIMALIPVAVALLAVVKLFFAGPVSLAGIGNALLDALPDMILLPFVVIFSDMLKPDPHRLPDSDEKSNS